ncbi:hypothetical protein SLEP1_g11816 [Rubroshorea leprosula]|nr:hypothetical protein SLEP1_g11816 [Rubroshorea leprosula]
MGPDLELKEKSKMGTEVLFPNKESRMASQDPEDKLMHSVNDCHDHSFNKETVVEGQAKIPDKNEDVELDITECSQSSEHGLVDGGFQDATETSSSFSDTAMGADNDAIEGDAESPLLEDGTRQLLFDDEQFGMRKRKLTDHWRRFISPLMWRCKWIELQLKEFKSQALKYDRELAEYDHKKQVEFKKITFEDFDTKSQPFSFQVQGKKVMKRKKRKRVEETTDMSTYMSHHNLFSYFAFKKSGAGNAAADDKYGNSDIKAIHENDDFGINDEWTSPFGLGEGDDSLEQILWRIEVVKSQVCNLIARVDKVMSENPGKFSSINKLTLMDCGNASPPDNGDEIQKRSPHVSVQPISEFKMEDLYRHQSAVSSHGEAEEDILIQNKAAQEELRNYGSGINLQEEKPQALTEKPETISADLTSGGYLHTRRPKTVSLAPGERLPTKLKTISAALAPQEDMPTKPKTVSLAPGERLHTKLKAISPALAPGGDLPSNTPRRSIKQNSELPSTSKSKVPTKKRKRGKRKLGRI